MPFDRRNSKDTLLAHIKELEEKIERVYEAGIEGIEYVGRANYFEREQTALQNLNIAMYGVAE